MRYVRESGRSKVGSDGRVWRLPGSVQDVTDDAAQGEASQEFPHLRETVHHAQLNQAEFLPNISQQLRVPLTAIISYLQWMRREHGGSSNAVAMRHGLPEIAKTGQYLLALVADVLDLARLEAGRMEVMIEPVSVQELFLACEAHTVALAAASNISLSFDLGPCTLCKVLGDMPRLKQALLNVIANAIKYNRPNGKVQVVASFAQEAAPHSARRLHIRVSDTGYGLSADNLARLYTPFDRLGTEQGKGTGLGLAISQQILQLMGGQIAVESSVGLGSSFTLDLSLAAEQFWHLPAPLPASLATQFPANKQAKSSAHMEAMLHIRRGQQYE